jgi:hypothetical protein
LIAIELLKSSEQRAPAEHFPSAHLLRPAQSSSFWHVVKHSAGPHLNAPQSTGGSTLHMPVPSQRAVPVAWPSVQEASWQITFEPAKPAHDVPSLPSQLTAWQGWSAGASAQAGRPARGAPWTATHLPSAPFSPQAEHWPSQALLQQKPSTQKVLAHSLALPHDVPSSSLG